MLSARTIAGATLCLISVATLLYYITVPSGLHLPFHSTGNRRTNTAIVDGRSKFTPDVLIQAPRRSAATPNAEGTKALFTVSTYSFETHSKTKEIKVLDLETRQSTLLSTDDKASEPSWLGDGDDILWLKEGDAGTTKLIVGNAIDLGKVYEAGTIPGPVENLKLHQVGDNEVAIAVSGKATPNGTLFNPEQEKKRQSTGVIYDFTFVRHWDEYVSPNRNAIWYGLLRREGKKFVFSGLNSAMHGSNVTLESPIPAFGGIDHFDIGKRGIAFVAKDPLLNPSTNTMCNVYFIPITDFTNSNPPQPREVQFDGFEGAATSPVFSHSGKALAFLQMKENGYESDKNRLFIRPDLSDPSRGFTGLFVDKDNGDGVFADEWFGSPSTVSWSADDNHLYMQAEDMGLNKLFNVDQLYGGPQETSFVISHLTHSNSVSTAHPLGTSSNLLVSSTNLIDNSIYSIISANDPSQSQTISSNSQNGSSFNLSPNQITSITFPGASKDQDVHAWVVKPSNFSSTESYPLAYLIHGGPQGAWNDQWSTRWNPAVFAEQGYVVITPNPTGSTGYGQAFTDAIREQWGGLPYEDLVNGFEYIKENLDYVDTNRAVALGASYGGYMMNWMQGHPLGKEFKALVCHDGVFSMANQMSSDEQYFPNHDLGGPYWQNRETWEKWNPARFTGNWSTPMLVIHNEKDYRLPISEGLAMFNVLQERGIKSRFLSFPDENHWVLKEQNSLLWHTVVLNWINSFVGLPPYRDEAEIREYIMSREK